MEKASEKSLEGIGGWLVLPLLSLSVTPFRLSFFLYKDLWPVFSKGHWGVLTTPGGEAYHPLWAPLLIFEVIGNLSIIVLCLIALWFFLKRSQLAPKLVISWLAVSLAFVATDFFLADLIPAVAEQSDRQSVRELGRSVVGAAIWIPYFLVSKRVKATFVR